MLTTMIAQVADDVMSVSAVTLSPLPLSAAAAAFETGEDGGVVVDASPFVVGVVLVLGVAAWLR